MGIIIVRIVMLAAAAGAGLAFGPSLGFHATNYWLAGAGFLFGVLAVLLEWQARKIPVDRIFWGSMGGILGLGLGLGLGTAMGAVSPEAGPLGRSLFGLLFAYLGAAVALAKRDELEDMSVKLFPKTATRREAFKILDTSVIIDGRIVDLCEAGFLEGTLVIPQFVLRELQQIADSPDPLKRNRGKRGFDVLQRVQRIPGTRVRVEDQDFPHVREVDRKLIELGKLLGGKVVTNDYNLNKVAELSGVPVLNVNELANALKPVVLPGEVVHVHVVKEGKESSQGVAYLDDGTMVVIDHGKRFIGQPVTATVTSVLQTTAGRMIFARLKDDETSRSGPGGSADRDDESRGGGAGGRSGHAHGRPSAQAVPHGGWRPAPRTHPANPRTLPRSRWHRGGGARGPGGGDPRSAPGLSCAARARRGSGGSGASGLGAGRAPGGAGRHRVDRGTRRRAPLYHSGPC